MTESTPNAAAPGVLSRRAQLVQAGLELLETHGPEAVTTRRVSQAIGRSSQALYSDFGSIGALVQGIAEAGFACLEETLAAVPVTDDAIRDLVVLALAYRDFALDRPRLYEAMYAMTHPGGYRRSGEELLVGTAAFMHHVRAAERAIAQRRLADEDPVRVGLTLWVAVHGWVTVELSGYLAVFPGAVEQNLAFAVSRALEGLGDAPERCRASVDAAFVAYGGLRRR